MPENLNPFSEMNMEYSIIGIVVSFTFFPPIIPIAHHSVSLIDYISIYYNNF